MAKTTSSATKATPATQRRMRPQRQRQKTAKATLATKAAKGAKATNAKAKAKATPATTKGGKSVPCKLETGNEQLLAVKENLVHNKVIYTAITNNVRLWASKCKTFLSQIPHINDNMKTKKVQNIDELFKTDNKLILGSRNNNSELDFRKMNVREIMTSLQTVIKDYHNVRVCDAFIGLITQKYRSPDINVGWVEEIRAKLRDHIGGWDFEEWYANVSEHDKYTGFPSACSLWIPYQSYDSHIFLVPSAKWDGFLQQNIRTSNVEYNQQTKALIKSDFAEPLSSNETGFTDAEYTYKTGSMSLTPSKIGASVKLKEKNCILNVANTSGTTLGFISFSRYFKGVDTLLVVLACILWMVPHDHSLHEIFVAARVAKVEAFLNYDFTIPRIPFLKDICEQFEINKRNKEINAFAAFVKRRSNNKENEFGGAKANTRTKTTKSSKKPPVREEENPGDRQGPHGPPGRQIRDPEWPKGLLVSR